ncbi:MAG: M28 family peptidase [Planctomycetota bacterium]|jgi:hypothetical protein
MNGASRIADNSVRAAFVMLSIACGVGILAVRSFAPPEPIPINGSMVQFSAERAMRHLTAIATEPRPIGSPALGRVRNYLLRQLGDAGVEADVQHSLSVRRLFGDSLAVGWINNVAARVRGTDSNHAILLVAHYDSASVSPGGVDNASGTATLLELIRAVQAGPRLKSDVIVLFADGEEASLLGSSAFVDGHPWMAHVKVAVNLDAAGTGPPIILRTSSLNGVLVERYAESAPRPTAMSFVSDLGRLLPGDRDIIPFLEAGIPGLDFASAAWSKGNHSALDLPDQVDIASLQHMGAQLLALSRQLANQDLDHLRSPDRLHFPLFGMHVHYTQGWAIALSILVASSFVFAMAFGVRNGIVSCKATALSAAVFVIGLACIGGTAWLLWRTVLTIHPEYGHSDVFRPRFAGDQWYALGLVSLAIFALTMFHQIDRRGRRTLDVAAGPWVIWALLAVATSFVVPGVSYLFVWPLLFQVSAFAIVLVALHERDAVKTWGKHLAVALAALPTVILWAPLPYLLFKALGLTWAPVLIGMLWLSGGGLILQIEPLLSAWRRKIAISAGLAALVLLVLGHELASSGELPLFARPTGYWYDADKNVSYWVTKKGKLDHRQRHILGDVSEAPYSAVSRVMGNQIVLVGPAPATDFAAPAFEILEDIRSESGLHTVRARITPVLQERMFIFVHPELDVLAFGAKPSRPPTEHAYAMRHNGGWCNFRVEGGVGNGIEVRMETSQTGPIHLVIIDVASQLPTFPGIETTAEPGAVVSPPEPGLSIPTEFTAIQRSITLP